jgi:hypothetical protein
MVSQRHKGSNIKVTHSVAGMTSVCIDDCCASLPHGSEQVDMDVLWDVVTDPDQMPLQFHKHCWLHVESDVAGVSFHPRHAQCGKDRANWWAREEHPLVVTAGTVEQHELRGIGRCPAAE